MPRMRPPCSGMTPNGRPQGSRGSQLCSLTKENQQVGGDTAAARPCSSGTWSAPVKPSTPGGAGSMTPSSRRSIRSSGLDREEPPAVGRTADCSIMLCSCMLRLRSASYSTHLLQDRAAAHARNFMPQLSSACQPRAGCKPQGQQHAVHSRPGPLQRRGRTLATTDAWFLLENEV